MIRLRDRRRIRATAADGATSVLPISKDITLQWGAICCAQLGARSYCPWQ